MSKPVIEIKDVSKKYGRGVSETMVLKNVNLEIHSGEYIIIFGPSGCGKSTLLNCLSGLEEPTDGKILVRGDELTNENEKSLAEYRREKIGIVFQQFNLLKGISVLENIALPQLFKGVSYKQRVHRAKHLLGLFGLEKFASHRPSELSGGQLQRVAMARSLVNSPWILLIDEPTGNLDSKSANEVMELINSLNQKSKRTIILVTHNPDYLSYPHRVIYMKDGQITREQKVRAFKHEAKGGMDDITNVKKL